MTFGVTNDANLLLPHRIALKPSDSKGHQWTAADQVAQWGLRPNSRPNDRERSRWGSTRKPGTPFGMCVGPCALMSE
jgi:hypothetical protein